MRRDVYIDNDSGGFSVVAADAVDAIIADARQDDFRFVQSHKAMLIELYGDDSMPVRLVVDEPLTPDEDAQWLARYTWQIDTSDGRMLVMGGFDPDVLSWWKDDRGGAGDGQGIGAVEASPGRWRVDVYAHAGSMNGRAILSQESKEKPGAAFRRSHQNRPFPLWLVRMLEFSGDEDPGHEALWKDVQASMQAGTLAIDTVGGDAIGFLVHFTRAQGPPGEPPEEVWIGRTENMRIPEVFPLGLPSEVPDPDLRRLHDRLLGIEREEAPRPIADAFASIIESWPGDPLEAIEGGAVSVPVKDLYLLHWMAGLMSDTTPRFELRVEPVGPWTPPAATPDFAVKTTGSTVAIGPVMSTGGWHTWWTSRGVAQALGAVPDGSTIDLAAAPDDGERVDPDSTSGQSIYSGTVSAGQWQITDASPLVTKTILEEALAFLRELITNNRIQVRPGDERRAFDKAVGECVFEEDSITFTGDVATLGEPDERMQLMLAPSVFRVRFGQTWPFDAGADDDEE